ncbi:hypothetical protein PI95_027765 [Hassallia byssoidea VB512170]|uniref:Uncharacterized protein n=2 Tax=Hassallia TaxID=482629 RepID=A0A846HIH8_9CYAN|nr:hypothetical protein [Hassalia byssoidea VB512170]
MGNGEWGMGNGERKISYSLLPTPYSLFFVENGEWKESLITNLQCPMPNYQLPITHSPLPNLI